MASIPLSGISPPLQNPLEQYARIMGIKSAQQEQQLQQQQLVGAQQENQMRQMQLQDQQGMRQAYMDAQGDPDKFLANVKSTKYGVSFNGIMSANQGMLSMRKAYMGMTDAQIAQSQKISSLVQAAHDKVAAAPVDQRENVLQQERGNLQNLPGAVSAMPQHYTNPDDLKLWGAGLQTHEQIFAEAQKQKETEAALQSAQARANQAKVASERLQAEMPGGPLSPSSRAAQTLPYDVKKAGLEANARLPYEQQLKNTPGAQVGLTPEGQVIAVRPGMTVPAGTQTTAGYAEMTRPTQQTKQMGETAATLRPHIQEILQEVNALDQKGKLGPIAGRWQDFIQGRIGTDDPEYAQLAANMALLQTGVMKAHVGARGGEMLLQHFEKFMNPGKQSAANMRAQLGAIDNWMANYEKAGRGNFPSSVPTASRQSQPAQPQQKGNGNYWDQFPVHQ